jgi:hypothetical protein
MKKYTYVRLGFSGESLELDGDVLHISARRTDLNRLLQEGWRPVRETAITYFYWRFFWKCSYPYVLILLEKDIDSGTETP